jgi:hypothetical protein
VALARQAGTRAVAAQTRAEIVLLKFPVNEPPSGSIKDAAAAEFTTAVCVITDQLGRNGSHR